MTQSLPVPLKDREGLPHPTPSLGVAELISALHTMTIPCSACRGRGFIPVPLNTALDFEGAVGRSIEDAVDDAVGRSIPHSITSAPAASRGVTTAAATQAVNLLATPEVKPIKADINATSNDNTTENANTAGVGINISTFISPPLPVGDALPSTATFHSPNPATSELPKSVTADIDTTSSSNNTTVHVNTVDTAPSVNTITDTNIMGVGNIAGVGNITGVGTNPTYFPPPLPIGDALPPVTQNPGRWYCVSRGRQVGVFHTWPATSPSVTGISGACFVRYSTYALAAEAFNVALENGNVATIPRS